MKAEAKRLREADAKRREETARKLALAEEAPGSMLRCGYTTLLAESPPVAKGDGCCMAGAVCSRPLELFRRIACRAGCACAGSAESAPGEPLLHECSDASHTAYSVTGGMVPTSSCCVQLAWPWRGLRRVPHGLWV